MSRSLKVIPGWIKRVNLALSKYEFSSQKALAEDLGITARRASDFFNGRSVDYETFVAICQRLDLDWQKVAKVSAEMLKPPESAEILDPPQLAIAQPKGLPRLASSLFRPIDSPMAQKKVFLITEEPPETAEEIPDNSNDTSDLTTEEIVPTTIPQADTIQEQDGAAQAMVETSQIELSVNLPAAVLEPTSPPNISEISTEEISNIIPKVETENISAIAPVLVKPIEAIEQIISPVPKVEENISAIALASVEPTDAVEQIISPVPKVEPENISAIAPVLVEPLEAIEQIISPDPVPKVEENISAIAPVLVEPLEAVEQIISPDPVPKVEENTSAIALELVEPPEAVEQIIFPDPVPKVEENISAIAPVFVKPNIARSEEITKSKIDKNPIVRLAQILSEGMESTPVPSSAISLKSELTAEPEDIAENVPTLEDSEDLSQVLQQMDDFQSILRAYYDSCDLEDWDTAALSLLQIDWNYIRQAGEVNLILNLLKHLLHDRWLDGYHKLSDPSVQCQILYNAGIASYYLENYSDAVSYHESAKAIADQLPDLKLQTQVVRELGQIYQTLGQYQTAIKYNQEYLTLAQEDQQLQTIAFNNLGNIYYSLRQYRTAIKYYLDLLGLPNQFRSMDTEFSAVGNLGNAYYNLGDFQSAINYQQRYLEFTQLIKNSEKEATARLSLGFAYYSLGLYQTAIANLQKVLEIATDITDDRLRMSAFSGLGLSYQALHSYQTAAVCFHKCLQLARLTSDRTTEIRSMSNLRKVNAYLTT